MDTALNRLEKQDFGLAMSRWIIHGRHVDVAGKDVRLVLGVDERAVVVLEAQTMQPYLGMGRASFRLRDAHPSKGKEDKTGAEEDATQDGQYVLIHTD